MLRKTAERSKRLSPRVGEQQGRDEDRKYCVAHVQPHPGTLLPANATAHKAEGSPCHYSIWFKAGLSRSGTRSSVSKTEKQAHRVFGYPREKSSSRFHLTGLGLGGGSFFATKLLKSNGASEIAWRSATSQRAPNQHALAFTEQHPERTLDTLNAGAGNCCI
eukprot:1191970-Prorocentrum_minimum.AAC.3